MRMDLPNPSNLKAGLLTVILLATLSPSTTTAETYVAGQFGVTLPSIGKGLSNQELTSTSVSSPAGTVTFPSGTEVSDQSLKSSFLFGAKFGHFFRRYKWFGIEAEVFHTTPHIKQQPVTLTSPSSVTFTPAGGGPPQNLGNQFSTAGDFQGAHFRVFTLAPLNFVFRYPGNRLQPYVAVGPGIFFGRISTAVTTGPDSQSSTALGLNTQVGLRYHLTRHVSMFGEWKYNYARFNFKENDNFFGVKSTYSMNHFAFGLAYHF
jgi:opacity protein-like surface antigen